jgi:pyridoxamine 5'-phosphate oxidase
MDLDALRADLQAHGLAEHEVDADPGVQFGRWFTEAREAGIHEPEAMVLSTVAAGGAPSSRHVLLRGWSDDALSFFTNYDSQKGLEIEENPLVAVCFPWNILGRQVRMAGRAERTSTQVSDDYFATRPRGAQIGAWASPQSTVLADRAELEARVAEVEARFEGVEVPRPPNWGGYRIIADEWEFWQGRPSRLHDRILYTRQADGAWRRERLQP